MRDYPRNASLLLEQLQHPYRKSVHLSAFSWDLAKVSPTSSITVTIAGKNPLPTYTTQRHLELHLRK